MLTFYWHDGEEDFPHGAGASVVGWYMYRGPIIQMQESDLIGDCLRPNFPSTPISVEDPLDLVTHLIKFIQR